MLSLLHSLFRRSACQLNITPTPVTAALAGIFSAIVWPLLWARFGSAASSGTVEVVVITLLVIALPAHAFVVGFGRSQAAGRAVDTALLKRIGAWLLAAAATAAIGAAIRTQFM
jgi:hypothetical protein